MLHPENNKHDKEQPKHREKQTKPKLRWAYDAPNTAEKPRDQNYPVDKRASYSIDQTDPKPPSS